MKWISVAAGVALVLGFGMVYVGQVAIAMKVENREGLMLYGMLLCAISCVWLAIHGLTAMLRKNQPKNPPDSGAT